MGQLTKEKIRELSDTKCTFANCEERQSMYIQIDHRALPFCPKHSEFLIMEKPKMDQMAKRMLETISKDNGKRKIVHTFDQFRNIVKDELLYFAVTGADGKCSYCTDKAVILRMDFTPTCEKHSEFPRAVPTCALKDWDGR